MELKMSNFISTKNTLTAITDALTRRVDGGYLRFGDGDTYIAEGKPDKYQVSNSAIQKEMIEAFALESDNLYKAFPHHTHTKRREPLMEPGNMIFSDELFSHMVTNVSKFWSLAGNVYSAVALHQQLNENPDLLIEFFNLCKTFNVVFVGNKKFDKPSVKCLFGESVEFIDTLPRDAYKEIDKLEKTIIKSADTYKLYVMCSGMTSRILTKRLVNKVPGFFFDIGSVIDVFLAAPRLDRTWLRITDAAKNAKYVKQNLNQI